MLSSPSFLLLHLILYSFITVLLLLLEPRCFIFIMFLSSDTVVMFDGGFSSDSVFVCGFPGIPLCIDHSFSLINSDLYTDQFPASKDTSCLTPPCMI